MKHVLLTGASGFLGSEIFKLFYSKDFFIDTLGRSDKNNIIVDLSLEIPVLSKVYSQVIHCSGKAHSIPKNKEEVDSFFNSNFHATINLCKAFEYSGNYPEQFVFISTIAVYGLTSGTLIDEETNLKGVTPYAQSKIEAEKYLIEWGKMNNVNILILRIPLIVGDNPPGNLGKMIRGIKNGFYFSIGSGLVRKSMVMAQDIAHLILLNDNALGIYNLTDGCHPFFCEIESLIYSSLGKSGPKSLPLWAAKFIGFLGGWIPGFPLNSETILKITSNLTFCDMKARKELDWRSKSVLITWKPTS
jgi:nucleoside-diphosphate-sugar epimerase